MSGPAARDRSRRIAGAAGGRRWRPGPGRLWGRALDPISDAGEDSAGGRQ